MELDLPLGALCRARCGPPARYLGGGLALFVSCQGNDLFRDEAAPPVAGEGGFPLPTDEEVERAAQLPPGDRVFRFVSRLP